MTTARKHSRKRDAILDCVRGTTSHPPAEWIYAKLKAEIPDLSLGTVYRNLTLFKQEGIIQSIGTVNGLERFDGCTAPHAHFICTECDKVDDVASAALSDRLIHSAEQSTGGSITSYHLNYYGICSKCKSNKE